MILPTEIQQKIKSEVRSANKDMDVIRVSDFQKLYPSISSNRLLKLKNLSGTVLIIVSFLVVPVKVG